MPVGIDGKIAITPVFYRVGLGGLLSCPGFALIYIQLY
jgi:hypothetical protein